MTLDYEYSFNKTSNKLALLLNSKRTVILNVLEKVNLHKLANLSWFRDSLTVLKSDCFIRIWT